jgi:ABC-type amino acid transport substrate-binding protein
MNMIKSVSTNDRRSELSIALAIAFAGACVMAALAVVVPAHAAPKAPAPAAVTSTPAPLAIEPVAAPPIATLDRIKSAGRIVFGYRADAAPMSSRDASGQPVGYSIALCSKVADALKQNLGQPALVVEWVAVGAGYGDLEQRKVDLVCAADEVTLAHRAVASFSIPVFPGGISALVRSDAPDALQRTLEERPQPYQPLWRGTIPSVLEHRTYSAIGGSATIETLKARIASMHLTASVAPVDSYDAGVTAVLQRRSDVLFGERAQLLQAVRQSPAGKDLRLLSRHYVFAAVALALTRNDDDFRLAVDRALTGIYANPQFGELYTATFGAADTETVAFFRSVAVPQ